ncbi:hypothetical protein B0H63DRAFT_525018 [Podospora didyma]|uniref:Peptidase A1 domain-containing protein n=1 Tax=Podospora didyma TaxID=330526 RepID=A0AAE0NBV6_9PEZI|nr:hypothetical protein B0H63DRAFT_525018 [Podospora didyma]
MAFTLLVFQFLAFHSPVTAQPQPYRVPWSIVSYGPDGPWPALHLRFGNPAVNIDAYPGGAFYSLLLTPDVCNIQKAELSSSCDTRNAGLYNPSQSRDAVNLITAGAGGIRNESFHGTQTIHGDANLVFDTLSFGDGSRTDAVVSNATILALSSALKTLPSGKAYKPFVGNMALGAGDKSMFLGSAKGSIPAAFLFDRGDIPSYSFGLHIGSPSLSILGSLSGSRLVVDLVDISIGVADEKSSSLFKFSLKTPAVPTAYLGFTFRYNASITKNFDIKIPFKLLNLTLTAPLVDRPTPYFPCSLPTLDSTGDSPSTFRLGRAFLQAAFIGVNWLSPASMFFLAQAPGPLFSPSVVRSIQPNDVSVATSGSLEADWVKTW